MSQWVDLWSQTPERLSEAATGVLSKLALPELCPSPAFPVTQGLSRRVE
jgi:hypothetical protein